MKILAFGHEKDVGKDTAAGFAMTITRTKNLVRRASKAGFADKLKAVCFELYGWGGLMPGPWYEEGNNRHLKEIVLPKLGKTPRRIWIDFGNSVRAAVRDDTWYRHQ